MIIEQKYTNCLAQGAYYIESEGEAAIIDPLRETEPYIQQAQKNQSKIKYIFETHFHADFVSGHVDLAKKTGAKIVFGPNAETSYESYIAKDGEEFKIGKLTIKVLHTPGHTLESSTFLLLDESKKPHCIFSGDTLFIGDVGRPDLAIKSNLTQEDLAGMLYDSLHQKIMTLPDDIIVYPAHGAGSACGKNLSKETFDTLGNQKKTNYALANISKEDFIKELTSGILPPPQYFPKNAKLNKVGYEAYDKVIEQGIRPIKAHDIDTLIKEHKAIILDIRKPQEFAQEHIPGSWFIGIDGQFAPWTGALIKDLDQAIILVSPAGREKEAVTRLSRVGYDHCIGYLEGGIEAWKKAGKRIESITSIDADTFSKTLNQDQIHILDVRKPGEHEAQHLAEAHSRPLDYIEDWVNHLDPNQTYYIHCAGGYRSMIAASILKSKGKHQLIDIAGGFGAIQKAGIPTTNYVCPSTKNKSA